MLNYSLSVRKNGGTMVALIMTFSCHSNHCLVRPLESHCKKKDVLNSVSEVKPEVSISLSCLVLHLNVSWHALGKSAAKG